MNGETGNRTQNLVVAGGFQNPGGPCPTGIRSFLLNLLERVTNAYAAQ
jgi:hypothetical protein